MGRRWLVGLIALALVPAARAQRGESILFQEQPPPFLTAPQEEPGGDCAEMARELEELEGKPQRRYSLWQRYQAECQGGQRAPTLPGGTPGEP
jgi:hypothetical protein